MVKVAMLTRVECPVCSHRLMDKGKEAAGPVQAKCTRCKRVWEVELATNAFKQVGGKFKTRRKGDNDSPCVFCKKKVHKFAIKNTQACQPSFSILFIT
ncbi:hypothetical protein ACXYMX_15445 [Sporosarcina sp. CAU 1771]